MYNLLLTCRQWCWIGILVLLLIGGVLFTMWIIRRSSPVCITPEQVLASIENAGFKIEQKQDVSYYPGPMLPAQEGIQFSTFVDEESFNIVVALYSNAEQAAQNAQAVNALNRRMGGQFGYAFTREKILLLVGASDERIASQFNRALYKVEGTCPTPDHLE